VTNAILPIGDLIMTISVSNRGFQRAATAGLRAIAWITIALLSLPLAAGLTTAERMTYQGRLLDNGTPFTGTIDMTFSLWTQQSEGSEVTSQAISNVEVTNGLFQVQLFFGERAYEDSLWIEVVADGVTLTPRQPITAVPLALQALNGGGDGFWELNGGFLGYSGPVSISNNTIDNALSVNGDLVGISATANGSAVIGTVATGSGVQGIATNNTAENSGVYGTSFSELGVGVRAVNTHPTGTAIRAEGFTALRAQGDSTGVFAEGEDNGVFGQSPSNAIFGAATSADGFGGYFAGVTGSRSFFGHPVGITSTQPTAMLEINGPGVNNNGRALRISVNDDEKLIVGNLGTSIYQPVFLDGALTLTTLATGGSIDLCRTNTIGNPGQVATCSSSARYKTDIESLGSATELVEQLRPVTFRWIETGEDDYGFVAEEVAEIDPRLATYNADGQVEGVKYRQISALLLRALQEQQQETRRMSDELEVLSVQLERSRDLEAQNRLLTERLERLESLFQGERSVARQD
jgi:hypothetical protein